MSDTSAVADSIDWNSALATASQGAAAPVGSTPTAFAAWAGPAAERASSATGIDTSTILGQWGLETGWGQHVIPGTNNLGNIKTKSGGSAPGVSATDNQLGTSSNYQSFPSLNDFADHYSNLINSNYKGAANTGSDAQATAQALAQGGYAQDPQYAQKLVNATQMAQQAKGNIPPASIGSAGGTDWDTALGKALNQTANVATNSGGSLPFGSTDAILNQYSALKSDPTGTDATGNPLEAGGAGAGEAFGKTVLGAQSLVGKGLQAVGANGAGDWLVNDAAQGNQNLTQQANAVGGGGVAQQVGEFAGNVLPAVIAGPEILPQALAGAAQSAGSASLNNQPILPSAVEGAGLGAGGAVAGKAIGALVAGAKPLVSGITDKFAGGEGTAVRQIANSANNLDAATQNLATNSGELIPGSLPTAAEAANDTGITAFQRGLSNTEAGQAAFPARQAANDQARVNAGQASVGNLQSDLDSFTEAQANRVAQGQSELPPLTQEQADAMQTPTYMGAIRTAQRQAADNGLTDFAAQQQTVHQGLAGQIDQVAGTPQTLEAARTVRSAQAADDYSGLSNDIDVRTPGFGDLAERPGVMAALREAATGDANRLGSGAEPAFTTQAGEPRMVVQPDGSFAMVAEQGPTTVNAQTLIKARSILSDQANAAAQSGMASKANDLRGAARALDEFNSNNIPGFSDANSNYAANSVPIHQQTALQTRLNGAVDPLTGEVNPNRLASTIRSIEGEQMKPGTRPADRVTGDQLAQLQTLGRAAQRAPTNLTGLSAQGQEVLRQTLARNAEGANPAHDVANEAFHQYLSGNSPSYQAFHEANTSELPVFRSRAALQESLDKIDTAANNAQGGTAATLAKAQKLAADPDLSGPQRDYAIALLNDLKRRSTMNAQTGAAGSQTAANLNAKHGILAQLANSSLAETTLMGSVMSGHILTAAASVLAKGAIEKAAARTEKSAIDLLLDPARLAKELEAYKNQPTAASAFMTSLRQRAGVGSMAGAGLLHALSAQANEREQK